MMTKPSVVPTERLIYQLNDYTCDGTINTFIDTGIKLFGFEYDAFRIEMEYDSLDLITQHNQETIIECKSLSNGNGLTIRTGTIGGYGNKSGQLCINTTPLIENQHFGSNGSKSSARINYVYNKSNNSFSVDDEIKNFSGTIFHNDSLTIGGRYASENNPDRFVQVHISSLKIYATPSGIDTSYIYTPLTFKCLTGGDLSIKNANTSYDRNFEYSLNGGAWTAFDLPKNTASKLIATLSPNDTISFRRDNVNFADAQFISDSNLTFDIYGNLLSLQYGSAFNGQTELRNTSKQAFGAIFKETNVVDASKLMLTATSISNGCYGSMFNACTHLEKAPEIYATTLVGDQGHFQKMFSGCSSLIKPPSCLYANTLTVNCYNEMFRNCVSLTYAPIILANNVSGNSCCKDMFSNCTSLVEAPELPATSLGTDCYREMFYGCTSIITAPALPATTLAQGCYQSMFDHCTSLTTAPELLANTLAKNCYSYMFKGCTSLTTAPNLPATTLAVSCYFNMFRDCENLVSVQNELPATTIVESCYNEMFFNCRKLVAAPALPAQTLVTNCYLRMFNACYKLNYVKCLATDISATGCIDYWLFNTPGTGTFVKASGVTWPSGASGIPNGWTVIEE